MIATAHLFRPLGRALLDLLQGLDAADWKQPATAEWSVSDVAAHLLDVDLRRLSIHRDAHQPVPPPAPIANAADLVQHLNLLNAVWIEAARRLSTQVMIDLLAASTQQTADLMEASDPMTDATFPVAWAGQAKSPMWLDVGREYTERWHHQDQIRTAVGAPPLSERRWLMPALEISLLALPHAYRLMAPAQGTRIQLHVSGDAGGAWCMRYADGWQLHEGGAGDADVHITMADLDLVRLLMHRLDDHDARGAATVEGDASLAEPLFRARAVMVSPV